MRCSIEQVHESVARAACDGNCRRGVISDPRIVGIHASDNRDSREQDEFGYLPAIERQFQHALVVYDLTYRCCACFHKSRVGLDLNGFGYLSNFKDGIDDWIIIHLQNNSALSIRAEARQDCF